MRDAARFLGSLVVRRWPWGSHYLTVGTLKLNVAPDTSRFIPICNGYSRVAALAYPAETLTARINLNERPVATLSTRDPLLSFFLSFLFFYLGHFLLRYSLPPSLPYFFVSSQAASILPLFYFYLSRSGTRRYRVSIIIKPAVCARQTAVSSEWRDTKSAIFESCRFPHTRTAPSRLVCSWQTRAPCQYARGVSIHYRDSRVHRNINS